MNKLLIVVDMQHDFIDGALGSPDAIAVVPKVIEKIKGFDGDIIFTMDTHPKGYLNTNEGKHLPIEHCIENSWGWKIPTEVYRANDTANKQIVTKPTFGSVGLKALVRKEDKKYDSIELVGLCTDICVISNALLLKAFFPEMPISVDVSCCAGTTPEKHQAAIEVMQSCQIDIEGGGA